MREDKKIKRNCLTSLGVVLGTLLAGGISLQAQTDMQTLQQENQDLKKRLDVMEDLMKKEGLEPSGDSAATSQPVKAMSAINISGYVSASYFYDLANNKDNAPSGYLWNTKMNSFTVNEIKLTLASPDLDKDKWDAGYRTSLLYGQDAAVLDPKNGVAGFSAVREAYVDLNIPIGTGLDIKLGELISLLNYESGDGGAANDNFSQGYQWYYTGNGPAAGVQVAYDFTDKFGIKLRLQDGLFNGPIDTGPKTFVGGLYFKPDDKTWIALLGFSGHQNFTPPWRDSGVELLGTRKISAWDNLSFATEIDYWRYELLAATPKDGDFYSFGAWLTGDLAPKVGWAMRADFLYDPTGFATLYQSPDPDGTGFPGVGFTHGQDLSSVTLTLNWHPAPNIKIQPEIRWNHSTVSTALNGKSDQVIAGVGASYAF